MQADGMPGHFIFSGGGEAQFANIQYGHARKF
jgi:hypothetical protein